MRGRYVNEVDHGCSVCHVYGWNCSTYNAFKIGVWRYVYSWNLIVADIGHKLAHLWTKIVFTLVLFAIFPIVLVNSFRIKISKWKLIEVHYFKHLGSALTSEVTAKGVSRRELPWLKKHSTEKYHSRQARWTLNTVRNWSGVIFEPKYWKSFEMWCWNRMEKTKLSEKVTNGEVLKI